MTTPNVDRLLQVVGMLTLYPERHQQNLWLNTCGTTKTAEEMRTSCGTAGCFAGWAVVMFSPADSVFTPEFDSEHALFVPDPDGRYAMNNHDVVHIAEILKYVPPAERLTCKSISALAREYLGLSFDQASWLFSGSRTIKQLLAGVKLIIQRPSVSYNTLSIQFDDLR